jgi:hypothetical protein
MKLSTLTSEDAAALAMQTLGLDAEVVDLTTTEGLAASLRRAASFMCPTSPGRLVDAVLGAVRPVTPDGTVDRERIAETLDLLVGVGDLLELRHEAGRSTRLLFLGPPSFVERQPGEYLLLGVRPFGTPLVDSEIAGEVEPEAHTRMVRLDAGEAAEQLVRGGLHEVSADRWASGPRKEHPADLLQRISLKLDAAGPSGDIAELQVLDPTKPVRFYTRRWRAPKPSDTGTFLARRPQAYGADLWCAVRMEDGTPQKLVEFPTDDPLLPGRDEAWRMQMAIDAIREVPQVFRVSPSQHSEASVLSFFSPLPGFAERRLELAGLPLPDAPKALFAFRVPTAVVDDLVTYLTDMLWMKPLEESQL